MYTCEENMRAQKTILLRMVLGMATKLTLIRSLTNGDSYDSNPTPT